MDSNFRKHLRAYLGTVLLFVLLSASRVYAETEVYRRQVKYEVERAKSFRDFQKQAKKFDRQRQSGILQMKAARAEFERQYEKGRQAYVQYKRREEAKKPSDEYIERMLAQAGEKEAKLKDKNRQQYKAAKLEVERAIKNARLNEAEEYQLD